MIQSRGTTLLGRAQRIPLGPSDGGQFGKRTPASQGLSVPAPRALPLSAAARKPFQPRGLLSVCARKTCRERVPVHRLYPYMKRLVHIIIRKNVLSRANLEISSRGALNFSIFTDFFLPRALARRTRKKNEEHGGKR